MHLFATSTPKEFLELGRVAAVTAAAPVGSAQTARRKR
jgi:hypothetical protein